MAKSNTIHGERLRSFIERIERLEEERRTIAGDIREVKAEAKAAGYDVKVINQLLKLRRMDAADRQEQEALLEVYEGAIETPSHRRTGESEVERVAASPGVRKAFKDLTDSLPPGSSLSGEDGLIVGKDKDGKLVTRESGGSLSDRVEKAIVENMGAGATLATADGRVITKDDDGNVISRSPHMQAAQQAAE